MQPPIDYRMHGVTQGKVPDPTMSYERERPVKILSHAHSNQQPTS
jgi:hypothetical protein